MPLLVFRARMSLGKSADGVARFGTPTTHPDQGVERGECTRIGLPLLNPLHAQLQGQMSYVQSVAHSYHLQSSGTTVTIAAEEEGARLVALQGFVEHILDGHERERLRAEVADAVHAAEGHDHFALWSSTNRVAPVPFFAFDEVEWPTFQRLRATASMWALQDEPLVVEVWGDDALRRAERCALRVLPRRDGDEEEVALIVAIPPASSAAEAAPGYALSFGGEDIAMCWGDAHVLYRR